MFNQAVCFTTGFNALIGTAKIQCYADLCDYEINGLGSVKRQGNDFIVTDCFTLKQVVNSTKAEIDKMALNLYVYNLVTAGLDPSVIKFQWHSHVDMPVFFHPKTKEQSKAI